MACLGEIPHWELEFPNPRLTLQSAGVFFGMCASIPQGCSDYPWNWRWELPARWFSDIFLTGIDDFWGSTFSFKGGVKFQVTHSFEAGLQPQEQLRWGFNHRQCIGIRTGRKRSVGGTDARSQEAAAWCHPACVQIGSWDGNRSPQIISQTYTRVDRLTQLEP